MPINSKNRIFQPNRAYYPPTGPVQQQQPQQYPPQHYPAPGAQPQYACPPNSVPQPQQQQQQWPAPSSQPQQY